MDSVRSLYTESGCAERYHDEAFTLTQLVVEATGGTVTFSGTGTTTVDDGRSLLDQAESAGLEPESGCRMGICHTCTRRLVCGTVRDVVTGDVTDVVAESAGAEIRICVSAPVGDVDIDL